MAKSKSRSLRAPLIAFILALVLFGAVIGGAFVIRSETVNEDAARVAHAEHKNCEAIRQNNTILLILVLHAERATIRTIKEGHAPPGTTAAEVRAFYEPTITRIHAVHCGG